MPRGYKIAKETPSIKYPGFFENHRAKCFSKILIWRERQVRHYFVERQCSQCGKDILTDRRRIRTHPEKKSFCSGSCMRISRLAVDGIKALKKRENGGSHVMIRDRNHPATSQQGFVYEHRQVMERKIGRYLTGEERVHHINMVKNDNRIENLFLCESETEHFRIHGSLNDCVASLVERGHLVFDVVARRYCTP